MFCESCGRRVQALSGVSTRIIDVKGEKISVEGPSLYCSFCGCELYDEDIETEMLKRAASIYRSRKALISPKTLSCFMAENGISPEELAQKVGCAVSEIVQASQNGMVRKEVSNELKKMISA